MCATPFVLFLVIGPLAKYFDSNLLRYMTYSTPVFLLLAVWMGAKFIVSPEIIELMLKQRVIARVADRLAASVHLFVIETVDVDMNGSRIVVESLVEAAKRTFQNRPFPMPVSQEQIAYIADTERTASGLSNPRMAVDIPDPFEWELRMAFPAFADFEGMSPVTITPYPPKGLIWWGTEDAPWWAAIGLEMPSAFNSRYGGWAHLPGQGEASARVLLARRLPRDLGFKGALVLTVSGAVQLQKDAIVPFDKVFEVKADQPDRTTGAFSAKARATCIDMARRYGAEFYVDGETLMIRSTVPMPSFGKKASPELAVDVLFSAIKELMEEMDILAEQLS
jgi:hypothetical protein